MYKPVYRNNRYGQTDFLRVSAARAEQRFHPARINEMSHEEVQRLANGHQVFAFVGSAGGENNQIIMPTQIPLKALAIISPVFNIALLAHNRNFDQSINNVILPTGDLRAYREIMAWVGHVVQQGHLVPMRDLRDRPITCYAEVIWIANRLRIAYLAAGLRRRVFDLLRVRAGRRFTMHPGDIRDAYTKLSPDHWAKQAIIAVIAEAELKGIVHEKFRAPLNVLYEEVIGFQADVHSKISQIQMSSHNT